MMIQLTKEERAGLLKSLNTGIIDTTDFPSIARFVQCEGITFPEVIAALKEQSKQELISHLK